MTSTSAAVSSSTSAATTASKPGTACLCCRRRKLKCSREATGCSSCRKADLPCIYPTVDTSVKKKRGPYKKKDRPARQAHLDHVVQYLSDPIAHADAARNRERSRSASSTPEAFGLDSDVAHFLTTKGADQASEELVKDAINALAQTSFADKQWETIEDDSSLRTRPRNQIALDLPDPTLPFAHPGPRQMQELWHIFTTRVDPATKVIHCNSFQPRFCQFMDGGAVPGPAQTLTLTVYFSAISSCVEEECLSRFGQDKAILLQHFRRAIEVAVVDAHGAPTIEFMQALVIYLTCICRDDSGADTWAIFALTVKNAQLLKLDEEPNSDLDAIEVEIRRRLWWTICSLETRGAEGGMKKKNPLLAQIKVQMPLNLNDNDLQVGIKEIPQPREGITAMSFVLVRFEIMRLLARIQILRRQHEQLGQATTLENLKQLQRAEFDKVLKELDKVYLRRCHKSRPFDWVVIATAETMMIKCRLAIDFPDSYVLGSPMTEEQRLQVLRFSVMVVRNTYFIMNDSKAEPFLWFFRSYLQWHSMAIVVSEISTSTNPEFVLTAWQALLPFINIWRKVYSQKQDDPTWKHVNLLIERAQSNVQTLQAEHTAPGPAKYKQEEHQNCAGGILPFGSMNETAQPFALDPMMQHPNPLQPFDTEYTTEMQFPSIMGDHMDLEALNNESMLDPTLDPTMLDQPLDVNYTALQEVFGSSNWESAFNTGTFNYDAT